MKIDLGKMGKGLSSREVLKKAGQLFLRSIKKIAFLLFFLASAYCGYVWYAYAYHPTWSQEKETQYLNTKDKDVTFNTKKFQSVVSREVERGDEYDKPSGDVVDIFRIGSDEWTDNDLSGGTAAPAAPSL